MSDEDSMNLSLEEQQADHEFLERQAEILQIEYEEYIADLLECVELECVELERLRIQYQRGTA